jgi:hypothetical protein
MQMAEVVLSFEAATGVIGTDLVSAIQREDVSGAGA